MGIVRRSKLKQISWVEYTSVIVFLTVFLTSQCFIAIFIARLDQITIKELIIKGVSLPSWIHKLLIFDLVLFIVFFAVVLGALLTALYLIRRFNENSNNVFITVTIVMNLVEYTMVCY